MRYLKGSTDNELSLKDAYLFYKSRYPKGNRSFVPKKLYLEICYRYNKELMKLIIEEGESVKLPYRLSVIRIAKRKMDFKKLELDYKHFNVTGKKKYYLNEHSDEYKASFWWQKSKAVVKNRCFYRFIPTRDNKRELAKLLKKKDGGIGHMRYAEKDLTFKI